MVGGVSLLLKEKGVITMNIKVTEIASHRNGISGEPFHVCLFHETDIGINRPMVAIVFEEGGLCAVLSVDETVAGNIAFAMGNSWRGDYFEKDLRNAIQEWENAR